MYFSKASLRDRTRLLLLPVGILAVPLFFCLDMCTFLLLLFWQGHIARQCFSLKSLSSRDKDQPNNQSTNRQSVSLSLSVSCLSLSVSLSVSMCLSVSLSPSFSHSLRTSPPINIHETHRTVSLTRSHPRKSLSRGGSYVGWRSTSVVAIMIASEYTQDDRTDRTDLTVLLAYLEISTSLVTIWQTVRAVKLQVMIYSGPSCYPVGELEIRVCGF